MQSKQSTFAVAPLLGLLALAAPMSACDEAAPANPTWIDDVQPQVVANCIRCHSYPARGGAPESFRLDVYRNTLLKDGTQIRGAEVMAEFMKQRAGVEGTMPPDFARGGGLRDTFKNWFARGTGSPTRGSRADNGPPQALLLSEVPEVDKEMLQLEYEVSDGDGDIVFGQFSINGIVVGDGLHAGRGSFEFYTGGFPEGDHEIVVEMSDGRAEGEGTNGGGFITTYPIRRVIGTMHVRHVDGNTAPTVDLFRKHPNEPTDLNNLPNPTLGVVGRFNHALLADSEGPAHLDIRVSDFDAADTHQVSIVAFRGDDEVVIESGLAVNGSLDYDLDTTVIPEGPSWRLRVTATDSQGASGTYESGTIYISHHTTTETLNTITPILNAACGLCHVPPAAGGYVPYFNFTLAGTKPKDDDSDAIKLEYEKLHRKIGYNKGNMYKRVAEERNMPPASAEKILESRDFVPLSDADRARLADYLLGGAPR